MSNYRVEKWREVYVPNVAMLRLRMVREGYEPFQWNERVGAYYNWHFHEEEQMHWIISGELEITIQYFGKNYTYLLKAGDRDYMPARMYHTAKAVGETDLLYLVGIKRKIEEPKAVEIIEEIPKVAETAPKAKKTKAKAKTTKTKTTKTKSAATKTRKKK